MAATKGNINWENVLWGSNAITRVTNASVSQGGSLIKFKGDIDLYPTIIANVDNEPSMSITTADVGTLMNFVSGNAATLVATLRDAKGAMGGNVIFTMANAVFETADTQAQHAQFGSVTASWQSFSSDGQTNPLGYSSS